MADEIKTGTILIDEGTLLPKSVQFERKTFSNRWTSVKNVDGYGIDRKIRDAGWHFFFMAGEIKAIAFGSDVQKTLPRAIERLLANLKSERFNCLEITQVALKHFLGLPYVRVSAHSRHIQESMFLSPSLRLAQCAT